MYLFVVIKSAPQKVTHIPACVKLCNHGFWVRLHFLGKLLMRINRALDSFSTWKRCTITISTGPFTPYKSAKATWYLDCKHEIFNFITGNDPGTKAWYAPLLGCLNKKYSKYKTCRIWGHTIPPLFKIIFGKFSIYFIPFQMEWNPFHGWVKIIFQK